MPKKIVDGFENETGHLGDRLISALKSGLNAGGEAGPLHSAGLQICDDVSWPVVDLRCDWTESCPIEAISNAWDIYKPQIQDYVQRALEPTRSCSHTVFLVMINDGFNIRLLVDLIHSQLYLCKMLSIFSVMIKKINLTNEIDSINNNGCVIFDQFLLDENIEMIKQ